MTIHYTSNGIAWSPATDEAHTECMTWADSFDHCGCDVAFGHNVGCSADIDPGIARCEELNRLAQPLQDKLAAAKTGKEWLAAWEALEQFCTEYKNR
jgi:hypothetical protein